MSRIANFSELYEAFLDIITRVGTDYRIPIGSRQDLYQRTAFSELIPRAQEITKLLCESLDRWRYPMTRLLGTLKAMYENSVMDELSNISVLKEERLNHGVNYLSNKQRMIVVINKTQGQLSYCVAQISHLYTTRLQM